MFHVEQCGTDDADLLRHGYPVAFMRYLINQVGIQKEKKDGFDEFRH